MGWDKLALTPEDFFGEAFDAVILPLREQVVNPQMVTPLDVGQDESPQAPSVAVHEDWPVVVVAQQNRNIES